MAIRLDFQVRPANSADQHQIADLIQNGDFVHRHLDWRNPLEWIGAPPYLVLEQKTKDAHYRHTAAAFACPPDPPQVAWIRLFAISSGLILQEAWNSLWPAAQVELSRNGICRVAIIAMKDWLPGLLLDSGFDFRQDIVILERPEEMLACEARPPRVRIRLMTMGDLTAVEAVDAAAFNALWHNSLAALSRAYQQAVLATVAESEQGVIGYQISTRNTLGAHLSRLAVRPEAQGQGVGHALVADLIRSLARHGASRLTVNTQSDNATSLALYRKLGFVQTGERYPVFEFVQRNEEKLGRSIPRRCSWLLH